MTSFVRRSIDIATARTAAEAAAAKAAELGLRMTVVVSDEAGVLKHVHRMDGASQLSAQIAQDKAYTSAVTGMPTLGPGVGEEKVEARNAVCRK